MRCAVYMVGLALAGCAADEPSGPEPITRACYRSFATTLGAWEAALFRVPPECALLDQEYTVQLVASSDIPCEREPGGLVVGCTVPGSHTIYLLRGRDNLQLTDSSVHEWIHALADCVDDNDDRQHLRAALWAEYGPGSVETQAQAGVTAGECL